MSPVATSSAARHRWCLSTAYQPAALVTLTVLLAALPAAAQDGPVVHAVRAAGVVELDGRPDEAAWQEAPIFDQFTQQVPHTGSPATDRTEVQIVFDDDALYVAVRAYQPSEIPIIADELRRDAGRMHERNDTFTLALDTFFDRRNGYVFYFSPLGAVTDWAVWDEGRVWSQDWDTVWDVRTSLEDWGWSAEMRLPFRSLRFAQPGPQVWGINLRRIVLARNEWNYAAPVPPEWGTSAIGKLSSAGVLRGLDIARAGLNLEVTPYLLGGMSQAPCLSGACGQDSVRDIGLDGKYLLTPNLTLDLTYNTDFSQVEADEQQINFTRFSLFFPEKRQFFLEGKGIFDFGITSGGYRLLPFFSRRIGIEDGNAARLQGGTRLSGKAGLYSVGALAIRSDGPSGSADASTFTVGRVRRDILRRSSIGLIAVDRRGGGHHNQSFGADAHFAFGANAKVESFLIAAWSPEATSERWARRLRLVNDTDRYGGEVDYLKIGRDFDPQAGFVQRRDIERWYGRLQASPRPARGPVRQWFTIGSLDYVRKGDGRLDTRDASAQLRVDLHSADLIQVIVSRRLDAPDRGFRVAELPIAPGSYSFSEVIGAVDFARHRPAAARVQYRGGGYYGGTRHELTVSSLLKTGRHLQSEVSYQVNRLSLPQGEALTHLTGVRVSHSATTRVFTSALVQWNTSTRMFDANVRFNWIYQPGSDLYVVFGRTSEDRGRIGEFVGQSVVLKLTKLLQL